MAAEQDKDESILHIKQSLQNESLSVSLAKKHLLSGNVLYFISYLDTEPILHLYIPSHLQTTILAEYHSTLGHMGIDKTYDAIRAKYYWANLHKDVTS